MRKEGYIEGGARINRKSLKVGFNASLGAITLTFSFMARQHGVDTAALYSVVAVGIPIALGTSLFYRYGAMNEFERSRHNTALNDSGLSSLERTEVKSTISNAALVSLHNT